MPDSASSPSVSGAGGHGVSWTWMGSPGARPLCLPSLHCCQKPRWASCEVVQNGHGTGQGDGRNVGPLQRLDHPVRRAGHEPVTHDGVELVGMDIPAPAVGEPLVDDELRVTDGSGERIELRVRYRRHAHPPVGGPHQVERVDRLGVPVTAPYLAGGRVVGERGLVGRGHHLHRRHIDPGRRVAPVPQAQPDLDGRSPCIPGHIGRKVGGAGQRLAARPPGDRQVAPGGPLGQGTAPQPGVGAVGAEGTDHDLYDRRVGGGDVDVVGRVPGIPTAEDDISPSHDVVQFEAVDRLDAGAQVGAGPAGQGAGRHHILAALGEEAGREGAGDRVGEVDDEHGRQGRMVVVVFPGSSAL